MIESKAFQSCFMYKETRFLTKRGGKGIISTHKCCLLLLSRRLYNGCDVANLTTVEVQNMVFLNYFLIQVFIRVVETTVLGNWN